MITIQQLTDLRLGKLKTAVSDWEEMVRKLRRIASGEGGDVSAAKLKSKAEAANWKGDNATVGKAFVTKTASEFDDAVTEAESVHAVLRDAYAAFVKHKADLHDALDELKKRHIHIDGKGKASALLPKQHKKDGTVKPSDDELHAAERRIRRILWEAHEDDRIAARALRAYAKHKYDFSDHGVKSLKDADRQQGQADAEYWVKKIKHDGVANWNSTELARFNEVLKNQRDNPAFAEYFATKVGGERTLQMWRDLAAPASGEILGHVQDSLSMTLATATHSHSPAMQAWEREVIAAGSKQFPLDGLSQGPYGYQVMSSLMRKGRFDDDFLHDYGKHLLEFERHSHRSPQYLWPDAESLNYPRTGRSTDPVNGFLEALGHNPEESLDFFRGSTGHGEDKVSNFAYLAGHGEHAREWVHPIGGKADFQSLGHALQSAALGYPYDDENPSIPPMETESEIKAREARTAFVEKVMGNYKSAELIDAQPGVRDGLVGIAVGNMDSINYSEANWANTGNLTHRDEIFNCGESHLRDFGAEKTQNFLRALCSQKDSYQTISAAQQVYGASLMAAQGDDEHSAIRAGLYGVTMHGMMDEARAEAIGKEYASIEDAKNKGLEKEAEWRNWAVGATIGTTLGAGEALIAPVGVAAVAVPLAFEAVGAAGETAYATNTIDWLDEKKYNNDQDAIDAVQSEQGAGARRAMVPLTNYALAHGIEGDEAYDRIVSRAETAYDNGSSRIDSDDTRGQNT